MTVSGLAAATFRVECGENAGSGFCFLRPDILVTNYHVVRQRYLQAGAVVAVAEDGRRFSLDYLNHSPDTEYDSRLHHPAVKVWILEGLEDAAREVWQANRNWLQDQWRWQRCDSRSLY